MGILTSELKFYKSTSNLGGAKTANEVSSGVLHDIFPAVTSAEAAAGIVRYACIYTENTNGTDTLTTAKTWLSSNTISASTHVQLGLGTSGLNGTEQTVANITTAPVGVTFDDAEDEANSLSLPDLPPGGHHALWIKWTVNAGAPAIGNDSATVVTKGDTPE